MKPIVLKAHERPITNLRYNREGDLLFTSSKGTSSNKLACVWYSETGEQIGVYKGHTGTVWNIDVNVDTNFLVTGSGDYSTKMFDVETGKETSSWSLKSPVRWVSIAEGDRRFLAVTDRIPNRQSTIYILDKSRQVPISEIPTTSGKFFQSHWGPLNKYLYSVTEEMVVVHDPMSTKLHQSAEQNTKQIQYLSFSQDKTHFVTASLDHTARLYDTATLQNLKTYETGRPVNVAVISPIKDHILLAGGESAEEAARKRSEVSQFKLRFFHKVFEEELAQIAGHFGPVHSIAFAPDGSFVSGGEDGLVRIHNLEDETIFSLGDDDDDDDDD